MKKIYKYSSIFIAFCFLSGCSTATAPVKNSSVQDSSIGQATSSNFSLNLVSLNPVIKITPGTPVKSSEVVQVGSTIYYCNWSDGDRIYKIDASGTGKQKLCDDSASELVITNNIIYYCNESDFGKLYSMNMDGTGRKKLLDGKVNNLIYLSGFIYFIDGDYKLSIYDTSVGNKITLNISTRCIDSDGTNVFFEDYASNNALSSINADGSNKTMLNDDSPMSISNLSGTLFYANAGDGNKIYKSSSDGTGKVKLNDVKSSDLKADSGWIYYINNSDYDRLYKIKSDGTGNTKLSDENYVKNYSVAGNYIYFNRRINADSCIYKINK